MDKALVIVESPAKAKTIKGYLGPGYEVKASMGHVRDLPKSKLGVDVEHDFAPAYVVIPERRKVVTELKKAAENASSVILAADPDREGEAISWHLAALLADVNKNVRRMLLHEITKPAVIQAVQHLGDLDANMFNAQQTRRILDRLVGYLISPLLWKKIGRGLSAGRVQSIAMRLIVEREKEIRAFVPEEYWAIFAHLEASNPPPFKAALSKIEGKKAKIADGESAGAVVTEVNGAGFVLDRIHVKEKKRVPPPPYTTSTLQQDAFRVLKSSVKRTMFLAQKLYEGLPLGDRGPVGLITYMRTDSVRVSNEAQAWARKYVEETFSPKYVPAKPHSYKDKTQAQGAHEAVRPTLPDLTPEAVRPYLKKEELSLYKLIWNRFMASQMSAAVFEETEFEISAGKYQFAAKGEVMKFDGFLALFPGRDENGKVTLPAAQAGEKLKLLSVEPKQNFTQPPPRYTEGTLVKDLEAKGIGRPSTYAPIIGTIQDRVYVVKDEGKFVPTELGMFVTDFLIQNFPDLLEVKFTARMEEELDRISEGGQDWLGSLREFYEKLDRDLKKGMEVESVKKDGIPVEGQCPKCGKSLVLKSGRFGRFKACSGYPECDFKESMVKKEVTPLEEKCPSCGSQLVRRWGRFGQFTACSNYPECKFIKKEQTDTGIACPNGCGGTILKRKTRRGRYFYGCSRFPKCRFATWDEPLATACPKCGRPFLLKKVSKKDGTFLYCYDAACGHKLAVESDSPAPEKKAVAEDVGEEGHPEKP